MFRLLFLVLLMAWCSISCSNQPWARSSIRELPFELELHLRKSYSEFWTSEVGLHMELETSGIREGDGAKVTATTLVTPPDEGPVRWSGTLSGPEPGSSGRSPKPVLVVTVQVVGSPDRTKDLRETFIDPDAGLGSVLESVRLTWDSDRKRYCGSLMTFMTRPPLQGTLRFEEPLREGWRLACTDLPFIYVTDSLASDLKERLRERASRVTLPTGATKVDVYRWTAASAVAVGLFSSATWRGENLSPLYGGYLLRGESLDVDLYPE